MLEKAYKENDMNNHLKSRALARFKAYKTFEEIYREYRDVTVNSKIKEEKDDTYHFELEFTLLGGEEVEGHGICPAPQLTALYDVTLCEKKDGLSYDISPTFLEESEVDIPVSVDKDRFMEVITNTLTDEMKAFVEESKAWKISKEDYLFNHFGHFDYDFANAKSEKTTAPEDEKPYVYFDLDGVLTHPTRYCPEECIGQYGFFKENEKMLSLAEDLSKEGKVNVGILAKTSAETIADKLEWIAENMPFVDYDDIHLVPVSAPLLNFVSLRENDIFLNDAFSNVPHLHLVNLVPNEMVVKTLSPTRSTDEDGAKYKYEHLDKEKVYALCHCEKTQFIDKGMLEKGEAR